VAVAMTRDASVFVHELGLCESDEIGPRTRIWAFVHVLRGARIGADCNVGDQAFVEGGAVVGDSVTIKNNVLLWDGVTVEDEVFLGPNATFTNDARPRAAFKKRRDDLLSTLVRQGATVGANATVVCGVTIGRCAFVAAGAVVVADVPDHALVVGNPARQIGWACRCGRTLPDSLVCACGRVYRRAAGGTLEERSSATGHDG
jgi:UDP-2-acetamido-3-amino-2,3-dideoxy-glucuronate N-acetyltransferase